jgi:hypothetical protein
VISREKSRRASRIRCSPKEIKSQKGTGKKKKNSNNKKKGKMKKIENEVEELAEPVPE